MTQRFSDESFFDPGNIAPNFNEPVYGYNDQSRHVESHYGDHFTDFLDAIKFQDYATFTKLLNENPGFAKRIDITSKHTPIFYVVQVANEDMALQMIRDLMAKGGDPAFRDPLNQNAISYIARDGRNKIFDAMASYGVETDIIDNNMQTPLYYAAREGRLEICRKILELGGNPNHSDLNGQTCLFYAAKMGHYEICKLLVDFGIKHDHVDKKKQTALAWAKKSGNQRLIEYLQGLKAGNKVQKEKPEPKAPPKKKGPKPKEETKTTFKLVFLNPAGNRDVTQDDFERFKRLHPALAEYLTHPETIPQEEHPSAGQKKDKWEKVAKRIIQSLFKFKDSYIFHEPVDPVKLNCFDYFTIIKNPMDFGTIKNRLNSGHYKKLQEFSDDVSLVFRNCVLYNGTGSPVGRMGLGVEAEFMRLCKENGVEQLLEEEARNNNLYSEHGDHESYQSFPDLLDGDFAAHAHDLFNMGDPGN